MVCYITTEVGHINGLVGFVLKMLWILYFHVVYGHLSHMIL